MDIFYLMKDHAKHNHLYDKELCKSCANYLCELGCLIFEGNDPFMYPGTCPDFVEEEDEDEE